MFSWLRKEKRNSVHTPLGPVAIYHHIAKTGGTSLRRVVRANYKGKALLEWYGPNRGSVAWWQTHYHALPPERKAAIQCIAAHSAHYIIPVIDRPFRVFTLVRDPVDRVVSLYYFVRGLAAHGKGKGAEMGRALESLGWDLEAIYRHLGEQDGLTPEQIRLFAPFFNGQSRAILGPHLDTATMPFVPGVPETLASFQITLRETLDAHYVLGLTERYNQSVQYFARIFGWRRIFFQRKNPTKKRPRLDELPSELIETIRAFNALDAWLHDYARRYLERNAAQRPMA